jgi:hypothetical protein
MKKALLKSLFTLTVALCTLNVFSQNITGNIVVENHAMDICGNNNEGGNSNNSLNCPFGTCGNNQRGPELRIRFGANEGGSLGATPTTYFTKAKNNTTAGNECRWGQGTSGTSIANEAAFNLDAFTNYSGNQFTVFHEGWENDVSGTNTYEAGDENYRSLTNTYTITSWPTGDGPHNFDIPWQISSGCITGCGQVTVAADFRVTYSYVALNTPTTPTAANNGSCSVSLNAINSTQDFVTWYWQTSTGGISTANAGNNPPAAVNGSTYYLRPRGDRSGLWGTASAGVTVTVAAQPTAPTITKGATVNVTSVCAGTKVSATTSNGTGGSGCTVAYTYRTRNLSNVWSAWLAYSSGNNIATTNTNSVEIRGIKTCTGNGCDDPTTTISWTVTPAPIAPAITKVPNLTNVCSGQDVRATFGAGSNGIGCSDSYEFRRRTGVSSWSSWASYTANTDISTSGFTEVQIKSIRGNCTANTGCDNVESTVSWLINNTPVAPTATKTPNLSLVCQGQNVSASFTGGSNGVGCSDVYQYRTRTTANVWSPDWTTYTPNAAISTTGMNRVEIRAAREDCTASAGCTGVENSYAWDVQEDPSVSIASSNATICINNNQVGLEATLTNPLGTPTYIWEQSPDNTTWSTATGATNSASYSSPTLTAQTYFRVRVQFSNFANTNCNEAISSPMNIQLPAAPSTTDTLAGCGLVLLNVTPGAGADIARFYAAQPPLGAIPGGDGTSFSATGSQTIWVRSLSSTTGCQSNGYDSTYISVSPLTFSFTTSQSNFNGFSVSCSGGNNGSATILPDTGGVAPFQYLWNTSQVTNSVSGLSAGTYTVTMTDANGCATSQSYVITQPPLLSLFGSNVGPGVGSFTLGCNGNTNGTVTLNATGGAGNSASNTYDWADVAGPSNSKDRTGLVAGNYTVTVTDINGCTTSSTYELTQPSVLELRYNIGYVCDAITSTYTSASINATGDGGVQPYQYRLNSGSYGASGLFSGLTNGASGVVWVRDINGCETSLPYSIIFPPSGTAIDACDMVYVSPTGSGSFGSKDCPTSITEAFTIYTNDPQRNRIVMLAGDYNFTSITIPAVNPSFPLVIDGAYEVFTGGDWRKNRALITKFNLSPSEQNGGTDIRVKRGFIAESRSNFTIQDVTIDVSGYAVDDRINGHGKSVYGVYLRNCSNYEFLRTTVITGIASSGANGVDGAPGNGGSTGFQGTGQNCGCDVCAFSPSCGSSTGGGGSASNGVGGAGVVAASNGGNGGNGAGGGAASIPNDNCPGKSANGGSGAAGSAGASGGGAGGTGAGGAGIGGDPFCGCDGTAASGTAGSSGANGTAGAAGVDATTPVYNATTGYWTPQQGVSHGKGGGGGQGGGGGGGGGSTSQRGPGCTGGGCDFLSLGFRDASRAPAGSGGGKGGGGGGGGGLGKGGGSAYGFFLWQNGANGRITDCLSNPGALGAKGVGGAGGGGGTGGNGGNQITASCGGGNKPGNGGAGGRGGDGGVGGKGGDGLGGERVLIYENGTAAIKSGVTVPSTNSPKAIVNKGCVNSEIILTKTGGTWQGGIGTDPDFVNNNTQSSTSYDTGQPTVAVYYTSTGKKDIVISGTTYKDFIEIKDGTRPLPVIENAVTNIPANICLGQSIILQTPTNGVEYEWRIQRISSPASPSSPSNVVTYTSKNPGTFVLNGPAYSVGSYQVKLRVKDACCGWSVPVYREFSIINPPANPGTISGSNLVCFGSTVGYSVPSGGTGVTGYSWTTNIPGAVITPNGTGLAGAAVTVAFPLVTSTGQLVVKTLGACGESVGQSTFTINFKNLPAINIAPASVCSGSATTITAGVGPGTTAPYTYSWQPVASISGANNTATINTVNLVANTTYSVTVNSANGCSASLNTTVNVTAIPGAPVVNSPTGITATGFTASWNPVFGVTGYFLDVATDNGFTSMVSGYNNLNVGNVLTYNITGLNPSGVYYYRVRSATGTCISVNSLTTTVTLAGLVWNGSVSTNWFLPANWTPNVVPNATNDVLIPVVPPNRYPVLTTLVNGFSKSLTINPGAKLEIYDVATLEVNGNFTYPGNNDIGDGTLILKGSSASGIFSIGNLVVNPNGILSLVYLGSSSLGSRVSVTEKLELQSGTLNLPTGTSLILKSNATRTAYVDDFSTGFSGSIFTNNNLTIERFVPQKLENPLSPPAYTYRNRYHYVGSITGGSASIWTDEIKLNANSGVDNVTTVTPRPNCDLEYLSSGSAFSNLLLYDETKVNNSGCFLNGWTPLNASAVLEKGKGFAARINDAAVWLNPSNTVLDETGDYSKVDVVFNPLSISNDNNSIVAYAGAYDTKGHHILSNPFWAPIDWELVTGTNLDGTMYLYDPAKGIYEHVNSTSPVALRYIGTNAAFAVMPLDNSQPSYSVTLPATARVNSDNNEFMRQRQAYQYAMKITAQSADGEADYTRIVIDNNFTEGYDNGYDARKMFSSLGVPSIYTRDAESKRNGILALAENTQTTTIPLGVAIAYNGNHTLTFEGVADFPNTSIIWLEDLQTGTIQYLRDNNIYNFTASKTDDADRFLLHFAPELLITATQANCDNENGSISINERGGLEWTYTVTDANNATINSNSINGSQETISQLPSGTYDISLTNTISGYQTTETVTVSQVATVAAVISTQNATVNVGDVVTVDATNTTGATNISVDMGDGTTYNNEVIVNHSYQVGGNYTVTLIANNDNCSAQSTLQVRVEDLTTGIADNTKAAGIKVYANQNELYIEQHLAKGEVATKVELYNMLGQIVSTHNIKASYQQPYTVTLQDVARGTYIARVLAHGKTITKRIVISE